VPEAKRIVALAIGIADAKNLPSLAGAHNGARAFYDWAKASGYEADLLLDADEDQPVTISLLKSRIYDIIGYDGKRRTINKPPIHRFVLYFAGHGVIKEIEQGLWLLSDWYDDQRAVAIEVLKRRLAKFEVKQISIFADACQKLPADVDTADLAVDPVLGNGPGEGIPSPAVDKFIAAHDGTATIMIPGGDPSEDRCLYSGVLMEGLWGKRPEAFSKLRKSYVTSSSLGSYLETAVPAMAKRYGRVINPRSLPTFPEDDNIYYGGKPAVLAPNLPAWPAPDPPRSIAPGGQQAEFQSLSRIKQGLGRQLLNRMKKQVRPRSYETRSGFAVDGPPIKAIWVGKESFAEPHENVAWWRVGLGDDGTQLNHPTPALIEFANGTYAALTSLPNFIASVIYKGDGVTALVYREVYAEPEIASRTEEALSEIESGKLTAGAKTNLAAKLRQQKHADPVLGIISAYLYDSIGDVESIRRMAYYYATFPDNPQPIPYDIALLGLLDGDWRKDGQLQARVPAVAESRPRTKAETQLKWTYEKTPATRGIVGGFWPWLRQGWAYLYDPDDEGQGSPLARAGLVQLRGHLMKGRFTTMREAGGLGLAELFQLHRCTP
jgi:hypothetical protein